MCEELDTHSRDIHPAHTSPLHTSDVNNFKHMVTACNVHSPIKPPQLENTLFDGEVLKWQEFWDQFEASTDKTQYSIDKLNYLKG